MSARIKHIAVVSDNFALAGRFYEAVFGLRTSPESRPESPWRIADYAGSGIERPALDHIGFEVDSLEEFQANVKRIASRNSQLAPRQIDTGPEGEVRLKLLAACRYGQLQLSDPDGVLLDVRQSSDGDGV